MKQFSALVARSNELASRAAIHAGTIAAAIYNVNRSDAEQPFLHAWDIFPGLKVEEPVERPQTAEEGRALFDRIRFFLHKGNPPVIEHEAALP